MRIEEVLIDWLCNDYELEIISRQDLFLKYLDFWFLENWKGEKIDKNKRFATKNFYHICDLITAERLWIGFNRTTRGYGFFIKKGSKASSEMAISALYPFGYLSHLSAMNIYKLGNVITDGIYFTCPTRKEWKNLCIRELKNRFNVEFSESFTNDYIQINGLILSTQSVLSPYPHELVLEEAGSTRNLVIINKNNLVESEWWRNIRTQNIIDLYLDMWKAPHYCGGLSNVLKVSAEQLKDRDFFSEVINNLEKIGSIIDRARFGFLFEKVLLQNHKILLKWKKEQLDKRGSSRKLFSNYNFDSNYDSDWNISINSETIKNIILRRKNLIISPVSITVIVAWRSCRSQGVDTNIFKNKISDYLYLEKIYGVIETYEVIESSDSSGLYSHGISHISLNGILSNEENNRIFNKIQSIFIDLKGKNTLDKS